MLRSLTRFAVLAVLALVVFPVFAQAPDGGTDPLLADLSTVAQTGSNLGHSGVLGTLAFIVASLAFLTSLARRFGKLLPGAVGAWFASPVATWVLPMVGAVFGALLTSLTSGQPLSLGLIMGAIGTGLMAGGFGSVPAKMEQLARADAAGADAAAKVTDTASAAETFRKGPNP